MKRSRVLLLVALVLFIVLAYFATSGYEETNMCKPRQDCAGDEFWDCDQCKTQMNEYVGEGEQCSFGVHCEEKTWCMLDDTMVDTNPEYKSMWETTLNGKTGTCKRRQA